MRSFRKQVLGGALALVLSLAGPAAWAFKCDVDNNGRIDKLDLALIQQATLARSPVSGPDDPRDADNNGAINSTDGRICALRCKYASCASNGAPAANAGPDQTVRVTDRVTLSAAASSDPDGDALGYAWTLTTRPAGSTAVLTGAGTVNPGFVADRPGLYVASLVVNDGSLSSAADTVAISTENSAPVANAGPDQSVLVGGTAVLDGRLSNDVDGDALRFSWRLLSRPAGSAAVLADATAVQPRLVADVAGSYEVELVVNDGRADSRPDTIVVSTSNSPPVARAGNNRSVALGALVTLDGSGSSDVDGNPLRFAWSIVSRPAGSTATLSDATAIRPSFFADRPGLYVAQLIVNDGTVDSAPASVTITTDNAAPVARAGADQTVPLGGQVTLDGSTSSDPEGSSLGYSWSLVSRPAGSTATLDAPSAAKPHFTADKPGSYTAQLIVSDGVLPSAPDTVVVSTENSRPVADAGPAQDVSTGATVQLDGQASRDADGQALSYAWALTTRPAGSNAAINPAAAARPTFVADLPGSYVAQLIVSDGLLASVPSTVVVNATTPNRAPTAVATANPSAVAVGATVTLGSAGSADPDGNPISFAWSLAARPGGSSATITTPGSANASFVPDLPGSYTVQLTVSDGTLSATALATVNATAANRAPVIISSAATSATVGAPYLYDVNANDPDAGDVLVYTLRTAPQGMAIQPATGLINWTPTLAQLGAQNVTVRVTDAGGLFAEQSFVLTVVGEATPLELAASLAPAIANAGETVTLTVLVSGGNGGALTRTVLLDGSAPLTLNAAGQASFPAPASGVHRVAVRVEAAPVGGSAPAPQTRDLVLTVRNAADVTAPVATITSPAADTEVSAAVPVSGTASDANLAYYQLLLRPAGTTSWTEIARGLNPVNNGVLGALDPTSLSNGIYELGLNVVDVNGRATSTLVPVEVARDLKLGQFRISFADIRADATGLPLMLTRTYDSTRKDSSSDFGFGWSAGANDISVRKNMVTGLNWQITTRQFQICLAPVGNRRVTVSLPDGGVYRFQARNAQACAFAQVPAVDVLFDPLPLPVGGSAGAAAGTGKLELANVGTVVAQGGVLYDMDALDVWNPTDFKFTSADGFIYQLRAGVGVLSVTDPYGNTVSYGPNGYQHSATLAIQLVRDAQGRVTRATDPTGKSLVYSYNANGELGSVTDRLGQVTTFQYGTSTRPAGASDSGSQISRHLLLSITDPRGLVVAANQFDNQGRLVGSADALGQTTTLSFDEANNQQRVVDRRGNASTYTFDAAGNVTRIVDALGGVTDLSYDANGNELTRKDPLGNIVTKTYNATTGKVLTERDALGRTVTTALDATGNNAVSTTDARGNVTSYSYPSGQQSVPGAVPSSIVEPLGRTTSIAMDAKGNLRSVNLAGTVTTYDNDAKGRRTRETDSLGFATNYTFDDNGNELTRSITRTVNGVARTETITRVHDGEGRVTQETDTTGALRRMAYNGAGKLATVTDALGQVTRYSHDANARLIRTEYPDGSVETIDYDANGNETARTDRLGRTTRQVYDALNRPVSTVFADGSSTHSEYDAVGRMTAKVDALGARTVYEYDAVGRMTAVVDASGRRTTYTYDANGNRSSTLLPDGRSIAYTHDALNRLTQADYPDGSRYSVVYRPDGQPSSETDERGVTTSYGYDAKGQLISVQQSGVAAATTHAYDEAGARHAQTDGNGRAVRWTVDAAGRPVRRTLPDGSFETFEYDAEGRAVANTTFGGQRITSTYDALGRELTRNIPATADAPARSIAWTYDAEGRRLTQTENGSTSSQGTTQYSYDTLGRLVQQVSPQGTLSWAYDSAGRVLSRTTSEGSTQYTYDADGRLLQMTAPDGRTTSQSHDAAGRLVRAVQVLPTGVELLTDRRYDAQGRPSVIAHSRRSANVTSLLAGQSIQRGTGGEVTRLSTFDTGASFDAAAGSFTGNPRRVQAFAYDANARLVQERDFQGAELAAWLGNANAAATRDTAYAYDAVGNRLGKTVLSAAGTETTTYAYDANDRLVSEALTTVTGSSVLTSYGWDANGNLAFKSSPGEHSRYVFDADNRLVELWRGATPAAASLVASYGYDGDGQRVRKTSNGQATAFLIDPTTTWPQVLLETRNGAAKAYVWGDRLAVQSAGAPGSVASAPSEYLVPLEGHLQSVIGAVDANAGIVEVQDAGAFGDPAQPVSRLSHRFAGEYHDADLRQTYLRQRWYDPSTARLSSLDRAAGAPARPQSLHRYAYAGADPLNNIDPSGNETMGGAMAGVSGMGTMSTIALPSYAWVFTRVAANVLRAGMRSLPLLRILARTCALNPRDPNCQGEVPTFWLGADYLAHTLFVERAQASLSPRTLHHIVRPAGAWYRSTVECNGTTGRSLGLDCDEYPYGSTQEGGRANYDAGTVRLEPVPIADNRGAGGKLRAFYAICGVPPSAGGQSQFIVVPVPTVAATFFTGRRGSPCP